MRTSLVIAAAAAMFLAGPSLAQEDHTAHHPAGAAAHSMEGMDAASMHEMCKGMMAKEMAPKSIHEHSREKSGIALWPNGKPLTKEEMAKMHEHCAAKMSTPEAPKS